MNIAVIGMGYVGLQVAVALGKLQKVVAFDVNEKRLAELKIGTDISGEVPKKDLSSSNLFYTNNEDDLRNIDFYIVAVPTPLDSQNTPDLSLLEKASKTVSKYLSKDNIVVYESTVYPGATEEVCLPILEKGSGLNLNKDFSLGYSPERINPGDKFHTFEKIKKVVAASNEIALNTIDNIYKSVVIAGTFRAKNIKTAEAAKVIENTQRDLNIALVNELAMLFKDLDLDTNEVLEAASTKWNFLDFKPGLVGGHCVGVDPYYLTHKAKKIGFNAELIISGRKINDSMPNFIVESIENQLNKIEVPINEAVINLLGVTFKENCSDIRNSKPLEIYRLLEKKVVSINVSDPCVISDELFLKNNISNKNLDDLPKADITIIANKHDQFLNLSHKDLKKLTKSEGIIFDIKNVLKKNMQDNSIKVWRL
jgi:UDP-N-acetyl-D-galactosamine dehydrogenase